MKRSASSTRRSARPRRRQRPTVERGFGTVKNALAPIFGVLNQVAAAVPALCQPRLAWYVATLLVATYLRVYAAGRSHLGHPLEGKDPDVLCAIVEEQRARARAEDRSTRLFLETVHAEYAMPGSCEAFVQTFRRYSLKDLHDAERRFRAHACRCKVRVCDRYFAAIVRDVHETGTARRPPNDGSVARTAGAPRPHRRRSTRGRPRDTSQVPSAGGARPAR
jgi:hypothetical protein